MNLTLYSSVKQLIEKHSALSYIKNHLRYTQQINAWLKKQLPLPLANHCQAICVQERCLTIAASSTVWLTQLHHLKLTLLEDLRRSEFKEIEYIKTLTLPYETMAVFSKITHRRASEPLSQTTKELLLNTSEILKDYPALAKTLKQLSQH